MTTVPARSGTINGEDTPLAPVHVHRNRVAALTRRELVEWGAALGIASLFGTAGVANAATGESAWRTIATAKGPVRVPSRPTRIACVANYPMENLFDFGIRPVGVPDGLTGEALPRHAAEYASIAKLGTFDQISVEKVAAVKPDLILGLDMSFNTPLYSKLSAIAPTALFALPGTSAWAHVAAEFGSAVGHSAALQRLKTTYHATATKIRKDNAKILSDTRWAIVTCPPGEWVIWYPDSSGGQVLSGAGIKFSKAAAGKTGNYKELSYEQLDRLADADAIAVYGTTLDDARTKQLTSQATWKLLPAVKAGHVYPLAQLFPYSYGNASALLGELSSALKRLGRTR